MLNKHILKIDETKEEKNHNKWLKSIDMGYEKSHFHLKSFEIVC